MLSFGVKLLALAALGGNAAYAQTFQRLGTCPTLGCVFPPDQADFMPGQVFDVRVEIHAPLNGSEAFNNGAPDEKFSLTIQRVGDRAGPKLARDFWKCPEPGLEKWTFNYFEDLFAQDAKTPTVVNVASKAYRQVALYTPGEYIATVHYYNTQKTVAHWTVRKPTTPRRKAKNVLFFIGDGMTISMQTAARLIAHKSVNGKYQSLLQLDQMDNLGHQMTHSIDSFITDSANSATALNTGHKSSVNALNVYADSSPDPQDDPKVETLAEMFRRVKNGLIGIVTTAFVADATPAAIVAHTRDRDQAGPIIDTFLRGEQNYSWPGVRGVDVLFGGGAENFLPGAASFEGKDYYAEFAKAGYSVVHDNAGLQKIDKRKKALGIFSVSNMAKWVDRKVKTQNLKGQQNSPTGDKTDALDQPGLKEMTLKAIDILHARSKADKNQGWYLMSEAASIGEYKMMHVLDYHRALGELLELDDAVRASIAHLKKLGIYDDTLIVVTADHGHGFDVFGGVDTQYLHTAASDRQKRGAVGNYINSGLSGYTVAPGTAPTNNTVVIGAQGANFPVQWDPRYSLAAGVVAFPDHRENYTTAPNGPRLPAVKGQNGEGYVPNPADAQDGFGLTGTLPTNAAQGVHSLTDVAVYANGPGSEAFRGVYNNVDIFFKMADALGLATYKNTTSSGHWH
ncbi:putative alkaline phosphatase [Auricularia subglabra TFB-10046 SS5]|uniref:alkaline phosphatase n=1 Tax=Auricularia subglabra (strain TFB-10046 / SS5) TaxID=717982 RepID=J0WZ23_AURST|nr:putative alkaline phosphatase [Auricularia subglabra TFB-10046 SS5]